MQGTIVNTRAEVALRTGTLAVSVHTFSFLVRGRVFILPLNFPMKDFAMIRGEGNSHNQTLCVTTMLFEANYKYNLQAV